MHFGIPVASGTDSMQIPKGKYLYVPNMSFFKQWPLTLMICWLPCFLYLLVSCTATRHGSEGTAAGPKALAHLLKPIPDILFFLSPEHTHYELCSCRSRRAPVLGETAHLAVRCLPVANARHQSPVFTKMQVVKRILSQ